MGLWPPVFRRATQMAVGQRRAQARTESGCENEATSAGVEQRRRDTCSAPCRA